MHVNMYVLGQGAMCANVVCFGQPLPQMYAQWNQNEYLKVYFTIRKLYLQKPDFQTE